MFSFTASAKKMEIVKSINPEGDFYIYGEHSDKVASALGMEQDALEEYLNQNGVVYLAVNEDNTKQIRVTSVTTDFSNSVINISGLSNDSITALIPDITGIKDAKGEVILKDGQKFVKTQFKTKDSGGEYILTEYFTVANRMCIALSFYTKATADTDYIEKTFESFSSPLFITAKKESGPIGFIVLAAAIIFGMACVVIVFTIIRDIKKENKESETQEETEENDN